MAEARQGPNIVIDDAPVSAAAARGGAGHLLGSGRDVLGGVALLMRRSRTRSSRSLRRRARTWRSLDPRTRMVRRDKTDQRVQTIEVGKRMARRSARRRACTHRQRCYFVTPTVFDGGARRASRGRSSGPVPDADVPGRRGKHSRSPTASSSGPPWPDCARAASGRARAPVPEPCT